jgi:hypothetical protein
MARTCIQNSQRENFGELRTHLAKFVGTTPAPLVGTSGRWGQPSKQHRVNLYAFEIERDGLGTTGGCFPVNSREFQSMCRKMRLYLVQHFDLS